MPVYLRRKKLSKGRVSLNLRVKHNGAEYLESLGLYLEPTPKGATPSEKQLIKDQNEENLLLAKTKMHERNVELNAVGTSYVPKSKKGLLATVFFQNYAFSYSKKDKRRIEAVSRLVGEFEASKSRFKKRNIAQVSPEYCEAFKDFLDNECNLSGETPYDYFGVFKKMLKQALREGYLKVNPAEGIKNKKGEAVIKKNILWENNPKQEKEVSKLIDEDCSNDEVKRAFIFSCYTGLGFAECKKLKWTNIREGRVKIARAKLKNTQYIDNKLHQRALEALTDWGKIKLQDSDSLVFNLPTGNGANKTIKAWVKKAGINRDITFYSARHTFAVMLLYGGANLKTVADCMAHASTEQTYRYLHFVDSLKDDAVDML